MNENITKRVKVSDIKPNPSNPRLIKDDKFKKLVKSVQDFPEMLELRPVVVNEDMVILGGNMRWKACKEAGLKEIPVTIASGLTPEQEREFIIKDNVSGGEWDWEILAVDWNADELEEWGLDLPKFAEGHDINKLSEDDLDMTEEFDPVGNSSGLQRVVFIFDGAEEAESYLVSLGVKYEKRNMAWQVNLSTQSIS